MSRYVGYEHLRQALNLSAFPVAQPAVIKPVSRVDPNPDFLAVPAALAPPADDFLGHALFALKHEGTNLQIMAEALPKIAADAIRSAIQKTPNGQYIRMAGYLWEAFTGQTIPDLPAISASTVLLFDPDRYVVNPDDGERSARWRVRFNGLGSLTSCFTVRRTAAVETALQAGILDQARAFAEQTDRAILDRALAWAYLDETQASFEIERESPSADKAQAFVALLRHAHERQPLTEQYLVELQCAVVSNPFDRAVAFRTEQNWLGNDAPGVLGVTYVPPPPDLAQAMMADLIAFANGPARQIDPLVAAACISFGFVFVHPFMDGNGRLSRFLFHHALCQSGQLPDGLILPVSIAMAKHESKYMAALQSFSAPARKAWRVRMLDQGKYAFDFEGSPAIYRYWDATHCVEFGFEMAQAALNIHLHDQVLFTRSYDRVAREINARFDVRGSTLSTLIVSCLQHDGRLSKRRRDQFANAVPDSVFDAIERSCASAIAERDAPHRPAPSTTRMPRGPR